MDVRTRPSHSRMFEKKKNDTQESKSSSRSYAKLVLPALALSLVVASWSYFQGTDEQKKREEENGAQQDE